MRAISDPGCDHHHRRRDRNRELILRDHRAPHPGVAANSANLGAEDRLDLKTRGVAIEVIHHLRARRIKRVRRRHGQSRQAGMLAVRMQMKPVVVPAPHRADMIGFFQHGDVQTLRLHYRSTCEPCRARTNNDGVGIARHAARTSYLAHTSFAISTARLSLAHCSSSERMLPSSVEAKPHCGDSASCSKATNLAASCSRRLISSFLSSSPNFEVMTPTTTTLLPFGR